MFVSYLLQKPTICISLCNPSPLRLWITAGDPGTSGSVDKFPGAHLIQPNSTSISRFWRKQDSKEEAGSACQLQVCLLQLYLITPEQECVIGAHSALEGQRTFLRGCKVQAQCGRVDKNSPDRYGARKSIPLIGMDSSAMYKNTRLIWGPAGNSVWPERML